MRLPGWNTVSPAAALRVSASGWPVYTPLIAYSAGKARHGEKLAEACASATGWVALPVAKFAFGAALGGPLAGLAAQLIPTAGLERSIYRTIRTLTNLDRKMRRLECGGDYRDTQTAQLLRQRAIAEMSGALVPARRTLGQEAALLHE